MGGKAKLIWDRWNLRHIKKHHVTPEEVEEAYHQSRLQKAKDKYRFLVYGQTSNDRFITIIISFQKQPLPYVVTARDMNKKEIKEYYDQT